MTMVAAAAVPRPAARPDLAPITTPVALVLVAALFAACHPYAGVRGDSSIYVMRVLADLDPATLGRDLLVVDDGQMRFSLFPLLVRPLVASLGAAHAAMVVAALGNAGWLAALAALASRLAPPRVALAMVAMVAVLPASYGDAEGHLFAFAETAATPRPLAEALVMAALAALLAGRRLPALALLVLAALLHPIMAAAGVGVAAIFCAWGLPGRARLALLGLATAAALAVVGARLADLPPFARLIVQPDADWLALLRLHSPHLFPTSWTSDSLPPLLAQAATIVVAARRMETTQRRLLLAALAVCGAGLATSLLVGDVLPLLVVIQAQAWRAAWLLGVLGGCALATCVAVLWADGPRGRAVLALLAFAWFFPAVPALTLAAAGLAVLLDRGFVGSRLPLTPGHAAIALGIVACLSLYWAAGPFLGWVAMLQALAPDQTASLIPPLRNNLHTLPLCLAVAAWLVAPPRLPSPLAAAALAIGALGLVGATWLAWDQRDRAQAYLETPQAPPGLAALAAGRPPEVLWVDDLSDAWLALERPQYFSLQQGVAIVFSHALAREWTRRADVLIGLGLAPRHAFTPWKPAADDDRMRVTQAAVDAFCARPDAPGLVVFAREQGRPALREMIEWRLPAPLFRVDTFAGGEERRRIDGFGIVPCAPRTPPR